MSPLSSATGMNSAAAEEPAARVPPAGERLEGVHAAVGERDHRLEVHLELAALDRALELQRELAALRRRRAWKLGS